MTGAGRPLVGLRDMGMRRSPGGVRRWLGAARCGQNCAHTVAEAPDERARQAGPRLARTILCRMSPNRRTGGRRLADMRASTEPEPAWAPDLPADHSYRLTLLLSERARYIQRLDYDERERLVEWAVIQSRLTNGEWQRVAVYDTCHGKGVHVHLFNRREKSLLRYV